MALVLLHQPTDERRICLHRRFLPSFASPSQSTPQHQGENGAYGSRWEPRLRTVNYLPPLALQWGGSTCSWRSVRIIALLVVFVVLLVSWLLIQPREGEKATIPPRIFLQCSIISGFCYSLCIGGFMLSAGYYLPL